MTGTPTVATLLLTDIVDSTRLVEQLGDARASAVSAAHDALARDLLPAHRGREIDRTDGFLHLFEAASDAVDYALAYHAALRSLSDELGVPITARVGIHSDAVILRENPPAHVARGAKPLEVEGIAKPVAARVMSLAVGGQTLLTGPVRAALGPSAAARSHGHYRLKGVTEPLELFELGTDRFTPPPDSAKVWRVVWQTDGWIPAAPPPHTLPGERDAFVGREADLAELLRKIDGGARLISVLGAGGSGKTRLVTRFAWTWLGMWPGGSWFVDLSEARSVDGICHAVARALDVTLTDGDLAGQLGRALDGRGPCLVVLDNFEQVTEHAAATVGRWLDRAARACFVVTSREILGLRGEEILALPTLGTSEGVALFATRAAQSSRGFAIAPDQQRTVEQLVALLDGLPLAIELAAARVRVMPPDKLLARMGDRFRLLGSSGGRVDRQTTLRATLAWSWDLLRPAEQAALAQLSVFEGGFTLEAAEGVLDLEAFDDAPWPMDAVQSLVDKSLVRRVSDARLDLLVSVQDYAGERLVELGGREAAEARHGAWFGAWGTEDALLALDGPDGLELRRERSADVENAVAASRRAVARGDAETAVESALVVARLLVTTGPMHTGPALLGAAVELAPEGSALRTRADIELASGHTLNRDAARGRFHARRALAAARALGDARLEAYAAYATGFCESWTGAADAGRLLRDTALPSMEALGDRRGQALVHNLFATYCFARSDLGEGLDAARAAIRAAEDCGDLLLLGRSVANLGNILWASGRIEEGVAANERALELARQAGNRHTEGLVLSNISGLAWRLDRRAEGRAVATEGIRICREVGNTRGEMVGLGNLGYMLQQEGQVAESLPHLERALALAEELGEAATVGLARGNLAISQAGLGRWDAARASFDQAQGELRRGTDLLRLGQLLADWGAVLASEEPEAARVHLDEADAIADRLGLTAESELRVVMAAGRAALAEGNP